MKWASPPYIDPHPLFWSRRLVGSGHVNLRRSGTKFGVGAIHAAHLRRDDGRSLDYSQGSARRIGAATETPIVTPL